MRTRSITVPDGAGDCVSGRRCVVRRSLRGPAGTRRRQQESRHGGQTVQDHSTGRQHSPARRHDLGQGGPIPEPVHVTNSGRSGPPRPQRVEGGSRTDRIPPRAPSRGGHWEPVPGSQSFQIKLARDMPDDLVLILNEPLNTKLKEAAAGREGRCGRRIARPTGH